MMKTKRKNKKEESKPKVQKKHENSGMEEQKMTKKEKNSDTRQQS